MPIQVDGGLLHTISGTELSRVRTELYQLRIFPPSSPHPVQATPQPASHGYFRNVPLPTHGQISIATSPVRILSPEPLVVRQPKFTRVGEPTLLCNP